MATKMETAIAALVIIAILVSAGSLYYTMTVTSQLAATAESVADLSEGVVELTGAMGDLATSMGEIAEKVGASVEAISAIEERLKKVEELLAKPVPELTVFSLWSGTEEENFMKVLDAFTEDTGIKVRHIPQTTEELLIGLPAQFAAGASIADLVLAPWPAWIRDLVGEGHIMKATGLVDETEYAPVHINEVKVGGVLYGTPFKMAGKPGFWYRVSFFEEHGLTEPLTYEDFKSLLADLKAIPGIEAPIASGNGVGWPLSDTTEAFIMGLGSPELQLDLIDGEVAWTSPEVRGIFEDLVELLEAGYFSVPDEWKGQIDKLWEGKYGIYFMGDWIAGMVPDPADLDFFPFPGTTGAAGAIDYAFIPVYTEHPEEAKELLKYLASAEAQAIWVELGGFIAPNLEVSAEIYTPIGRAVLDFLKEARVVPDLDDAIGGEFQLTFWDQLKLLWVDPTALDSVLEALQEVAPSA